MTTKWLLLLTAFLLQQQQSCCLACREVFTVDGHLTSPNNRGIFVSENFPHPLPVKSYCIYEFKVALSYTSDVLCFRFKELELFTVSKRSDEEAQILIGGSSRFDSILIYAGNGSLIWERNNASSFVYKWPVNLLNGPVCMHINYKMAKHLVSVVNQKFYDNKIGRTTRFYAEYEAMDSATLRARELSLSGHSNSSFVTLHRCLDGGYVNRSKRCNSIIDCGKDNNIQLYRSDFFAGVSSDESYEHAGCNSSQSFGTNFAVGQQSAQSLRSWGSEPDCKMDHSRHFLPYDYRDCSVKIRVGEGTLLPLYYRLLGIKQAANRRTATCYRLFWFSRGFTADNEALTLAEPDGGRVLLRLQARRNSSGWSMAEVQLEPGFTGSWINVNAFLTKQWNQTTGTYWLDDLSAEPAACDESAYESRMPSVCSFEWSTCGWQTINLPVVTDASVAKEFGVAISDHTSSNVPGRKVQPQPQRVLRLLPGSSFKGRLESRRRLPFSSVLCLEVWFRGIGYNGYSVRVEARTSGIHPTQSVVITKTAPINQWHRLSITLFSMLAKSPVLSITLLAGERYELNAVLLDDLSVTQGSCSTNNNGTVQCGSHEWRCSDQKFCIPMRFRCNGQVNCNDASDEANCFERSGDPVWSLILRIVIGISVCIVAFLALSICFQKRRLWWTRGRRADQRRASPLTVSDGRLPPSLRSDRTRRTPDMPPSYDEVAAGASNSGFAADEEPPKYDEIIGVIQTQEQQQPELPPQLPPRLPPRVAIIEDNREENGGSSV